MKQNPVLKSLANLLRTMVRPWAAKLELKRDSTSDQELQETLLLIRAEENSGHTQYRDWGIND